MVVAYSATIGSQFVVMSLESVWSGVSSLNKYKKGFPLFLCSSLSLCGDSLQDCIMVQKLGFFSNPMDFLAANCVERMFAQQPMQCWRLTASKHVLNF